MAYQQMQFSNAKKVIHLMQENRRRMVRDSLVQIEQGICAISLDVKAFKNIRNRLFHRIQDEIKLAQSPVE